MSISNQDLVLASVALAFANNFLAPERFNPSPFDTIHLKAISVGFCFLLSRNLSLTVSFCL